MSRTDEWGEEADVEDAGQADGVSEDFEPSGEDAESAEKDNEEDAGPGRTLAGDYDEAEEEEAGESSSEQGGFFTRRMKKARKAKTPRRSLLSVRKPVSLAPNKGASSLAG